MKKNKSKKKSYKFLYFIIVIFLFFLSLALYFQLKTSYYQKSFSKAEVYAQRGLEKLNFSILKRSVERKGFFPPYKQAEIAINIPFDFPLDNLSSKIYEVFSSKEIKVQEIKEQNLKNSYQILATLGFKKRVTHRLKFTLKKIKIALLIDDFGYSNNKTVEFVFKNLDIPLTVAIIPGTPYAKIIAEEAHRSGKEVMVHLPMEPKGKFNNNYKWIIMGKMERKQVKKTAKNAIEAIPHSVGLNNHMGSLVTERKKIMEPVLQVIKEKHFYFVDSKTNLQSIAFSLAKEMRVKSARRDIFLDNKKNNRYIEEQFKKLISAAKEKGDAIGIGHINYVTIQSLKKIISQLEDKKIQLVYVSELVN